MAASATSARAVRRAALDVLTSAELDPIVEMVLHKPEEDCFEALSHEGSVLFSRSSTGTGWEFRVEDVKGRDPLGDQHVERFGDLRSELSGVRPLRSANSYPHAYDQAAQLFDHAAAPDLCVIHSSAHHWPERGGHLGEHGSIDVVQARAPFVLAGAGVKRMGTVERACMLVDVAPTILALIGLEPTGGVARNGSLRGDAMLARQDGEALSDLIDASASPPAHVVGFLMDGCNSNVLLDLVARGEAPNIERIMSVGTTFGYGAISSLPTVTLANHTAILTGCFPGHHGILHNAWFDRRSQEQVITNSPATWPTSMRWLDPAVETVHSALRRARPGSVSVSVNEPCDSGATYSTFDLIRRGEPLERPSLGEQAHSTERFVRPSKDYRWSTLVDNAAVEQFEGIWSGEEYRGRKWPVPDFSWVNFTLTDSAFHEGGPYSEMAAAAVRDTDARIGAVLEAVERRGVWERTALFIVADHGMEETDPAVRGDWDTALEEAGIRFRDEGYGFVYLEGRS